MTFFEKRDKWQSEFEKTITKRKDIIDAWTDDSTLTISPDGSVKITYDNENITSANFNNVFLEIGEFFKTL